jgi:hypothetical protein
MGMRDASKWTEADDTLLRELGPKLSVTALAGKFGRTMKSVQNRAKQLGVRLKPKARVSTKLYPDA